MQNEQTIRLNAYGPTQLPMATCVKIWNAIFHAVLHVITEYEPWKSASKDNYTWKQFQFHIFPIFNICMTLGYKKQNKN